MAPSVAWALPAGGLAPPPARSRVGARRSRAPPPARRPRPPTCVAIAPAGGADGDGRGDAAAAAADAAAAAGATRLAQGESLPVGASAQAVDAAGDAAAPEAGESGTGGLMKDSVLEVKWKAERRRAESCSLCGGAGGDGARASIRPVEDPALGYCFTRIAAPTALLGAAPSAAAAAALEAAIEAGAAEDMAAADDAAADGFGHGVDGAGFGAGAGVGEGVDAAVASFRRRRLLAAGQAALPYSRVGLARRMGRYARAQRNRDLFLDFFCGEFDNYEQIRVQRDAGILPRDGGGHEHIHCSLTRLGADGDMLFARYYFNGDPSVVFRSRLYKVLPSDESDSGVVEMRIFRFYEETEQLLKASNYDITAVEWEDDDMYDWLQGCEVYWERYEPVAGELDAGAATLGIAPGPRFVGYMKGGGCELFSREIDGRIRVMDDLLLTESDLWVADRGFDEDGQFVYGNRRGMPYQMKRVDTSPTSSDPAAWTLRKNSEPPPGYVS